MNFMNKPFLLTLLFSVSFTFLLAQPRAFTSIKSFEEYTGILEDAKRNDQMLLVSLIDDNTTEGRQAKIQNETANFWKDLEGFKLIQIEIKSEIGAQWIQVFSVDELPAYFFMNKDEIVLEVAPGFKSVSSIIELSKKNLARKNLYQTLNTKYGKSTLSIEDWVELIRIHQLNFAFNQTYKLALEFLNGLEKGELVREDVIPVLTKYGVSLETRYPLFILNNNKILSYTLQSFNYSDWFEKAYNYNLDRAIFNTDTSLLNKIINPLIELSDESGKPYLIFATRQLYVEKTKDFKVMYQAVMDWTLEIEDSAARSRFIFDEAFKIADKNEDLAAYKVAAQLAGEAGKLQPEFRYKMLEAYSTYKLKDYKNARSLVNDAQNLSSNKKNQVKAQNLLRMIDRADQ